MKCLRFAGAATGNMTAQGGSGNSDGGGGGGGRIAVWRMQDTHTGLPAVGNDSTAVNGGAGSGTSGVAGGPGTVYWGQIPPPGVLIMMN